MSRPISSIQLDDGRTVNLFDTVSLDTSTFRGTKYPYPNDNLIVVAIVDDELMANARKVVPNYQEVLVYHKPSKKCFLGPIYLADRQKICVKKSSAAEIAWFKKRYNFKHLSYLEAVQYL